MSALSLLQDALDSLIPLGRDDAACDARGHIIAARRELEGQTGMCCQQYERCTERCAPRADYWRERALATDKDRLTVDMSPKADAPEGTSAGQAAPVPIGYRIEFRTGDYCFYSLEDFRRESFREGGRIHSLHRLPVFGCPSTPVAARGKHWCEWKHWGANAHLDPTAAPVYLGPELHDPADAAPNSTHQGQP